MDYKEFISLKIAENSRMRGYKTKLAEAAGCNPTYLSQVLGSHIHWTPDQAANAAVFWELDANETEYFICLLNRARAGTKPLIGVIESRMQQLQAIHDSVAGSVGGDSKEPLSETDRTLYYSAWYYSAIHILTSIRRFSKEIAIAKHLSLDPNVVSRTLNDLARMGLIKNKGGSWSNTTQKIHLPMESPLCSTHFANWRQKATSVQQENFQKGNLHYNAVHSLSKSDLKLLRDLFLETISNSRSIVDASPEETMAIVCLDVFEF